MPYIHINDIQMYYEIHSEGEPLLVIPGLSSDISEWGVITRPLAQHNRVIALDNRGAGRSDKPDQPYTIEMMANDTNELLKALGVERANILGVSMGGRIALALAIEHPELVDRLVLVSTSARVGKRPWWFGLISLISSSPIFKSRHPQPRYAFRRQLQASSGFNCTDKLGAIHVPTLILHGRNDKSAPAALAEEMHNGIPGSQLRWFAGGHLFLFFRERQPFLDAVTAFLGAHDG